MDYDQSTTPPNKVCFACGAENDLTWHHLVPKTLLAKEAKRRCVTRLELSNLQSLMCSDCHKQLHALIPEKVLAAAYDSEQKIMTHEGFGNYVKWKKGRTTANFKHRLSKSNKKRR
jgi:hypothetical protein